MTRRDALKAMPVVAAAMAAKAEPPGVIVRGSEPPNYETPFSEQKTFITPTEQFYVRNHFATPRIDTNTYSLEVTGAVDRTLKLSLAEIKALPSVTKPLTMECAGNGRVFLSPSVRGVQWQFGAVGTAEWTGVPLSTILDKAGVKKTAVEVILVGADKGAIAADPATPGAISFDRSLPLAKARQPEVLLAWAMNGEPLSPLHGFPLRAVIGGWYGMASVKWLTRIIVSETPYEGYWQTFDYSQFERRDGGLVSMKPLTAMPPKAQIAQPAIGETIIAGSAYTIRGMAWAGEEDVASVEVSVDGGATWAAAKLVGEKKSHCWRLWEYPWIVHNVSGPVKLFARCVDGKGRGQPEKRDADRRTYAISHLVPVEVTVKPAGRQR
jgi:DMSO/TMAO reductase YedYZ molybdopterin-dependent catalytic subunit